MDELNASNVFLSTFLNKYNKYNWEKINPKKEYCPSCIPLYGPEFVFCLKDIQSIKKMFLLVQSFEDYTSLTSAVEQANQSYSKYYGEFLVYATRDKDNNKLIFTMITVSLILKKVNSCIYNFDDVQNFFPIFNLQ